MEASKATLIRYRFSKLILYPSTGKPEKSSLWYKPVNSIYSPFLTDAVDLDGVRKKNPQYNKL